MENQSSNSRGLALPLPAVILAVLLGGAFGGAVGFIAHGMVTPPPAPPEPQVIKEALTPDELADLCKDEVEPERKALLQAHDRVKSLESDIATKEAEIAQLKKDAEKDASRKEAASKKWKEMENEIASLRVQLAQATQERDQLMTELQSTIKELNTEIKARKKAEALAEHYKSESTENLWSAFTNNAKVEVCDRGTRKRHDKCHEAVEAAFAPAMKERFKTCVDTYQAVPVLKQIEKKTDTLPAFAEWLPDDNKFTNKGWYIIFCDPTLPEAGANPDIGEEPAVGLEPGEGVQSGSMDDLQDE